MSTHSRTRSPSTTSTAGRERPTQWFFPIGDCAHPSRVNSRWHLPGAGASIEEVPDWHLLVNHDQDTARTTADQWVEDDLTGHTWVTVNSEKIEVLLGNAAAVIRSDKHTPKWERSALAGGVGYFAEVARLSAWLAPVDEHERRRRLALCVGPTTYLVVLSTPRSRHLATRHVHQQIAREWGHVEAPQAIGYLSAVRNRAPRLIQDRLHRIAANAICDPETESADRIRLCDLVRAREKKPTSRTQVLRACCLRVLADDQTGQATQKFAEHLLVSEVEI